MASGPVSGTAEIEPKLNPEPARELGNRLLTLQRFQRHLRLELRQMLLPFRHL